jgi:C-terminal processing protease CtpA/Prc
MLRLTIPFLLLASIATAAPVPRPAPPDPTANGYMGITMQDDASRMIIGTVTPGSPAQQAGVQMGDRIVQVGPIKPRAFDEVREFVMGCRPGTIITLVVKRNGEEKKLELALAEYPVNLLQSLNETIP